MFSINSINDAKKKRNGQDIGISILTTMQNTVETCCLKDKNTISDATEEIQNTDKLFLTVRNSKELWAMLKRQTGSKG